MSVTADRVMSWERTVGRLISSSAWLKWRSAGRCRARRPLFSVSRGRTCCVPCAKALPVRFMSSSIIRDRCAESAVCCAFGIDMGRCLFIDEEPGTEVPWLDALLRFARRTPPALSAADYPQPTARRVWSPRLRVLEAERAGRDEWLRSQGYRGEPLILVQPGNHRTMGRRRLRKWRGRDDKIWPVDRWVP